MSVMEVEAQQFVYTNVEEGDSPHRRRGFQSWLYPRHLTEEQRRQIEGHLSQFDWDPRTEPVERFLSTPLYNGFHLIARFCSLKEVDRFGRSGRFHAHGLILSDEDFKKLHYDPFRVIDAKPQPFQSDPTEVIEQLKKEKKWEDIKESADLGPRKFTAAEPQPAGAAVPEVVGWLVGLFQENAKRPLPTSAVRFLALPMSPAEVLKVARAAVLALPLQSRKEFSFDTLRPLRHPHVAHLSGAASAEWWRRWTTTTRYAVVEPGKPPSLPLPEQPSPWRELGAEWTKHQLTDEERWLTLHLAEWVSSEHLKLPVDPEQVTAETLNVVERCCNPREAWATKVGAVVDAALAGLTDPTFAFLHERARAHIGPWSVEGLRKFRGGITDEIIGQLLVKWLEERAAIQLKKEEIEALNSWAEPRRGNLADARKLELAVCRWHPDECLFDRAVRALVAPDAMEPPVEDAVSDWFIAWCRDSLPREAYTTKGLQDRTRQLFTASPPVDLAQIVRETKLGRAVYSQAIDVHSRQVDEQVLFAVAALQPEPHEPFDKAVQYLNELGIDVAGWLWEFAGSHWLKGARPTAYSDSGMAPPVEWASDGVFPNLLGVEIVCPEVGAGRAELAEIVFQQEAGRQFLRNSGAFPVAPPSDDRWNTLQSKLGYDIAIPLAPLFAARPEPVAVTFAGRALFTISAEPVCFRRPEQRSVFVGIKQSYRVVEKGLTPLVRTLFECVIRDPANTRIDPPFQPDTVGA